MAVDAAVLSLIIAIFRRGRLTGLADLFDQVKHFWLLVVPFAITIGWYGLTKLPTSIGLPIGAGLQVVATISFIAFFLYNLKFPGMLFLLAGEVANCLPILANGGKMPVSEWAYRYACHVNMPPGAMRHLSMSNSTHFNLLSDIVPIPGVWRIPSGVVSIGDIAVAVGLFMLIQYATCSMKKPVTGAADA